MHSDAGDGSLCSSLILSFLLVSEDSVQVVEVDIPLLVAVTVAVTVAVACWL